jgi:3-oxoacyl-[acyl-carrier-protein] synthase II
MRRRVVVTGLGAVSPLGLSVDESWASALAGRSGIGKIDIYDPSPLRTHIAGLVRPFDVRDYVTPAFDFAPANRRLRFALAATEMALSDAGVSTDRVDPSRIGISLGSNELHYDELGVGGSLSRVYDGERFDEGAWLPELLALESVPMEQLLQESHETVSLLSVQYGTLGPTASYLTACAAGAQAIGEAVRMVRRGAADVCITGGTDSMLTAFDVIGFTNLGALSRRNDEPERASRPFDVYRDGFVLGEGAAILVVESLEHALARGARIYAEIVGYGTGIENHHLTAMSPDAIGPVTAIRRALADARLAPEQIGYVNAHGTSTVENDAAETLAIKTVLGEHAKRIPVSSTKSMTGHLVAAAGAIEAVFSILALRDGVAPPTINYETPDPECDLDYVPNAAREISAEFVASNSFGFGGQNVTLVFGLPPGDSQG